MEANYLEKFYTFVYDLQFSLCGKYLAACDNYGFITMFSLSKALDPTAVGLTQKFINKWRGDTGPLYCLASNDSVLFTGGTNGIKGWSWKTITQKSSEELNPLFHFTPPSNQCSGFLDVNDIAVDNKTNTLYIACGSNIFCWDLTTESVKAMYTGHTKYVHSLSLRPSTNQFLSGSEDGTVKIWDPSQSQGPIYSINCAKKGQSKSERWVGSVSVDNSGEWMLMGGSTPPTLYKLDSFIKTVVMDVPEKVTTQTTMFTGGQIITGGSESIVRHWTMNGESIMAVPSTSLTHILSIAHNTNNQQYEVLAVSGDSAYIDIFTHFGYKAFSLSVY